MVADKFTDVSMFVYISVCVFVFVYVRVSLSLCARAYICAPVNMSVCL